MLCSDCFNDFLRLLFDVQQIRVDLHELDTYFIFLQRVYKIIFYFWPQLLSNNLQRFVFT